MANFYCTGNYFSVFMISFNKQKKKKKNCNGAERAGSSFERQSCGKFGGKFGRELKGEWKRVAGL